MSDTHRERLLRITFSRSGGFAPVFKGCELDPENLSEADAAELRFRFEQSGIMDMGGLHVAAAAMYASTICASKPTGVRTRSVSTS